MKKFLTILALTGSLLLSTDSFSKERNSPYNALTFRACQNVQMSPVRKPKEICATYFFWKDPLSGKEMKRTEIDERDKGYLPFQGYNRE